MPRTKQLQFKGLAEEPNRVQSFWAFTGFEASSCWYRSLASDTPHCQPDQTGPPDQTWGGGGEATCELGLTESFQVANGSVTGCKEEIRAQQKLSKGR